MHTQLRETWNVEATRGSSLIPPEFAVDLLHIPASADLKSPLVKHLLLLAPPGRTCAHGESWNFPPQCRISFLRAVTIGVQCLLLLVSFSCLLDGDNLNGPITEGFFRICSLHQLIFVFGGL